MQQQAIFYNGTILLYYLQQKNVKNINLRIQADGTVIVSANENVSDEVICKFLQKKAEWILKHQQNLKQNQENNFQCVSGEQYYLLGRPFTLSIINDKKSFCKIEENILQIHTACIEDTKVNTALVLKWTCEYAKKTFNQLIQQLISLAGIDFIPELSIRKMKSCWGTCHYKKQKITLNVLLIHKPIECIEYVILHELMHFHNPTHNKHFHESMTKRMPNWQQRRKQLNS